MNSLQNLIQRLSAIGQVTEAEEKCSKCGCTPCECDDKDKVEEGKKPDFLDADNDGNKKEPMSDALKDEEEKVKESTLDLLRRHSGIEEASKWRDAQYKDKLYTQEPPEEDQDDSEDVYYNRVKPDDYQGAKRSTFDRNRDTDKLHYPYGDYQVGKQAQVGDRAKKGLLTKNAIRVVKDRIKGTQGDHPTPKLPEGAMDTLKAMGKKVLDTLGHPDDEEMIKDMQRKAGLPVTGTVPEKKTESLNSTKMADIMGMDAQQLRMAVSRASNGKQTRSDIMLLSDTFVKLLNNPDDTVIQTVANLIKSGNTAPAPKDNMKQEGNEFSGALKAAKDAGAEEFEVDGKKYKVNECSDMSPMTSVPNGESHMGIPAEIMAHMSQHQEPEMSEPEGPHMEVPMAAEAPKYTLNITNGDNNLSMTTDMPDEIIHIMKLAGVNKGAEVTKKEMPADGEQEVEESGYENTPDNTRARDPQAHGDIRDWGQKGTGAGNPNYPGTGASGDNPMNEQRMFQDYKNFKAGK